jgi:hypothetical protein
VKASIRAYINAVNRLYSTAAVKDMKIKCQKPAVAENAQAAAAV